MRRRSALAGRRSELQRVRDALAGVADDDVLLVLAEAGVGKSQLVDAASTATEAAGASIILKGECLRLTEQMPLLPIITALRAAYGHDDGEWFRDALNSCPDYVRAAIPTMLPELRQAGEQPIRVQSDAWWRQRLFSAVGSVFAVLRESQPFALVVEDLHWADTTTLDLLDYVLRPANGSGFIPVVLTARDDDPDIAAVDRDWLSAIRTRPGVDVLRLRPLTLDETAEQIEHLLGYPPEPQVVADVFARSEGNALFTEQLVSQGGPPGLGLPHDLQALFEVKLAKLSSPAEQVAQTLAISGRPVRVHTISRLAGMSVDDVHRALRELHGQRLLRPSPGDSHTLRHALLADAVAARMLTSDRVAAHGRSAELLSEVVNPGAAEIAEHWQQAHDPEQELRWRLRAADDAASTFAPAQAAAHAARVLDLWDEVDQPEVVAANRHGQALLFTVTQLSNAGAPREVATLVESALAEDWTATEPGLRAELLAHAAFYRGTEDAAEGLRTSAEAVALFDKLPPSSAGVWALTQHGRMLGEQGQFVAAEQVTSRAIAMSAELPAKPMHRVLLTQQAWFTMARGDVARALDLLEQAWKPEFDPSNPWDDLYAAATHTDVLLKLGRFDDVEPVAERALGMVSGLNLPEEIDSAVLRKLAAEALIALGRPTQARQRLQPLAATAVGRIMAQPLFAELHMLAGNLDAAANCFTSLGDRTDASIEERLAASTPRAELELWRGDAEPALRRLLEILTSAGTNDFSQFADWPLVTAARCAADLGERLLGMQRHEATQALMAQLSAIRGEMRSDPLAQPTVPATSHPCAAAWRAETERLLGIINPEAWDQAAQAWLDLKMVHRAAYCTWRQAEAVLATRDHRDHARNLLRTAQGLASEHQPLTAAISATAQRARITLTEASKSGAPAVPTRAPDLLTERELAVLRLLAEGKTNNAIGKALYISPKTASVHVTNILRKLNVKSRVQAATVAERTGLLTDRRPQL